MADPKFVYFVEVNLNHPLAKFYLDDDIDFVDTNWVSMISKPYKSEKRCLDASIEFLKSEAKRLGKKKKNLTFTSEINPLLIGGEVDESFDDHVLSYIRMANKKGWIVQASIVVFGEDESPEAIARKTLQ